MQPENTETGPATPVFHPGLFLRRANEAFAVLHGTVGASVPPQEAKTVTAALDIVRLFLELGVELNTNLNRSAVAHETMAALAQADVQAAIDEAVKAGIEDGVNRKVAEVTKRSFIGKENG